MSIYDVIVVGGGHAGCEAAHASARLGSKTLLITMKIDGIGQMSCNPAIGGIGKSHLAREVDALDGLMCKAADDASLQSRVLNSSKGAAVRATRIQTCRDEYKKAMQKDILNHENLTVLQSTVKSVKFSKNRAEQWVTDNPEQRDLVERYIAQLTLPGTEQSLLSSIRNIVNTNFIPDYKKFSQFDIPIHIAYASDDDEIDPKTVQRVLDLIPRAESFVFTGGHGGGGFIVDELNNIFTDFLNKNLN